MDVQAAKQAIVRELSNRIALSGGTEVFRRLVGGRLDVIQEALAELVKDGWLKQTDLRVGTVYHYPPNEKSSLKIMWQAVSGTPAAAPARPAAPAAPAARPAPAAPAAPAAAPAAPAAATGPVRAKKKSDMSPEELAAAEARRAEILAGRGLAPGAPAGAAPAAPAAAAPAAPTGPIRAKKKSDMTPEELAEAEARRAAILAARESGAAPAAAAPAPPVAPATFSGPVRAKKKSEMTPEELAAAEAQRQAVLAARDAGSVPGTGPSPAAPAQEAVAVDETSETAVTSADVVEKREAAPPPEAPKVYTGPVRAKKKSEGG